MLLIGHEGRVLDLQAHPTDDNLLLSCSSDGTSRLFKVYLSNKHSKSFSLQGDIFVTGSFSGAVSHWRIPPEYCIRFVGDLLLTKTVGGRLLLWDPATEQVHHRFSLRSGSNQCRFDVTRDEQYVNLVVVGEDSLIWRFDFRGSDTA
ncbi:hypothetical protein HK105_202451 [Polyrhizophydium stewartii]|uniref:Uncharacterized protein n=1 Tax=Polyrhizophydium stewartii TaxID=2732419 RepID=A0ABR4NET2_9FUNG